MPLYSDTLPQLYIPGQKPYGFVALDRSHPLSGNLAALWIINEGAGMPRELVNEAYGVASGSPLPTWATIYGGGWLALDTNNAPWVSHGSEVDMTPQFPMTVLAIVKSNSTSATVRTIFSAGRSTVSGWRFQRVNQTLRLVKQNATDTAISSTTNYVTNTTDTFMVAAMVSSTRVRFMAYNYNTNTFIAAQDVANTTAFNSATPADNALASGRTSAGAILEPWSGHLAFAAMWKRELTDDEFRWLASEPFAMVQEEPERQFWSGWRAGAATYADMTSASTLTVNSTGAAQVVVPMASASTVQLASAPALSVVVPMASTGTLAANSAGSLQVIVPLSSASVVAVNSAGAFQVIVPLTSSGTVDLAGSGAMQVVVPLTSTGAVDLASAGVLWATASMASAGALSLTSAAAAQVVVPLTSESAILVASQGVASVVVPLASVSTLVLSSTGELTVPGGPIYADMASTSVLALASTATLYVVVPLAGASTLDLASVGVLSADVLIIRGTAIVGLAAHGSANSGVGAAGAASTGVEGLGVASALLGAYGTAQGQSEGIGSAMAGTD